ncbi:MAG: hypothetical protein WC672_07640 [Acidithiobacillus sp.]|jgi:hypothetical protein
MIRRTVFFLRGKKRVSEERKRRRTGGDDLALRLFALCGLAMFTSIGPPAIGATQVSPLSGGLCIFPGCPENPLADWTRAPQKQRFLARKSAHRKPAHRRAKRALRIRLRPGHRAIALLRRHPGRPHPIAGVSRNPYVSRRPLHLAFPRYGTGALAVQSGLELAPVSRYRYSWRNGSYLTLGVHGHYGIGRGWDILSGVDYVSHTKALSPQEVDDSRAYIGVMHRFQ